jgi:hypothetical protein
LSKPARAADEGKGSGDQGHVDAIVKSYLRVQQLLAHDTLEGVASELTKVHDAAAALSQTGDAKVQEQAKSVGKDADVKPKDLKEARAAFKVVSADVFGLVQVAAPSSSVAPALYEVYCPMAKADWLQTSKEIANPYFGKEMLECGTIKKTINSGESGKK